MWIKAYNNRKLTLDMEISTFCNAKCPQCSRTDRWNKLQKKDWLPTEQVSIDQFKKWLPVESLNHCRNIHFSGTYGDPGMCKDLDKIIDYIINESNCNASVNTNASMRDEQFWWTLAAKGGQRLHIIMDVDGINQEMHSFYRQGTHLDKVLKNLEAVADTDCKLTVLTVLFKHNQDYLEEIREMCRKLGVKNFDEVEGNNFQTGPIYEFIDEDGNKQALEQITRKDREQGMKRLDRRVRDHRHSREWDTIECLALEQNNLKVSVSGTITPCCYLSSGIETSVLYFSEPHPYQNLTLTGKLGDPAAPIIQQKMDNIGAYTLETNDLKDILESDWYAKDLIESWNDKSSTCFGCYKTCGKRF